MAQYEQGADIVMNVASGTGTGVLEAAKEAGKYAIGVDLNQDNDQPGHVVTSMVKHLGDKFPADIQDKVQELKDKIISGEIVVNNYEGFGKDAQ